MQKASTQFNEQQLYYLQETLKVSRKELIETIRFSHTSATAIADYVKKKDLGFRNSSDLITCIHSSCEKTGKSNL